MELLEQLGDYVDAKVVANRMAAYIALAIKSEDPSGMQQAVINQATAANPNINTAYASGAAQEQKWEPGTTLYLKNGEEAQILGTPQVKSDFDQEVGAFLRLICADIGLPLVLSMFNSSDTTYHGFKAEIAVAWRGFFRWIEMLVRLKRKLWRWRIGMAIWDGDLPENPDWDKIRIGIPPIPMIDPKAELEAAAFGINQSLRTRRDTVSELYGIDIDDLYPDIAAERKIERETGAGPVTMPGQQNPAPQNAKSQPDAAPAA